MKHYLLKNLWCFFWTNAPKYMVVRSVVAYQNKEKGRDFFTGPEKIWRSVASGLG